MNRRRLLKAKTLRPDWTTLGMCLALALIGVVMIFDASNVEGFAQFNNKFHFAFLQLRWLMLGFVLSIITAKLPLAWIKRTATPFMAVTFLLLIAVVIPGVATTVNGAKRWLDIAGVTLQPSELAKLALSVYIPSLLITHGPDLSRFTAITGLTIGLLMLEPDLGTALIIFAISFSLYFFLGAKKSAVVTVIGVSLLAVLLLIVTSPYRLNRLQTYLDPSTDPLGSSYHIRQVLISLGQGGWLGTGIGRSLQKYQYLPEAATDSIFAVLAEETGLVGSLVTIAVFVIIILRGFKRIAIITDPYAQAVATAVIVWIGVQSLGNIASMAAIIPLTGIPLPFLSYGGSTLVTTFLALGLYVNASRFVNPITPLNQRRRS